MYRETLKMAIETDVLVVGAGPAGLSAAIALKRGGFKGRVVVLDKGKSPGSHVLSGCIIDPSGFKGVLTDEEVAKLPVEAHANKESFRSILSKGCSVKPEDVMMRFFILFFPSRH